jgi:hypothetical protein
VRPRLLTLAGLLGAVFLLSACGEKPQQLGGGIQSDQPAHQGVGKSPHAQSGWQAGDANAWTQQLRARAQYGQNEYSRVSQP